MMSPRSISAASSVTAWSVASPAGSITHTARGFFSCAMRPFRSGAATAPSAASSRAGSLWRSNTTHWWPPCRRRRTILPPMRPRPITPICILLSPCVRSARLTRVRRPRLLDAVDEDTVDELVVEADQAFDASGLGQWLGVVPDEIVVAFALDGQVVVGGRALVGAAGLQRARRQQVEAGVGDRQVVAGGQAGLEQEDAAAAVGDGLAIDHDLDAPAGGQAVDAAEGIARVDEDLLVLLVPVLHLVPVEGQVAGDVGAGGNRLRIAPGRIRDPGLADLQGIVARRALVRALRARRARLEQSLVDIRQRKVIDRQVVGFVEQQAGARVGHGGAAGRHAQPLRRGHGEDGVAGLEVVLDDAVEHGIVRPAAAQMGLSHRTPPDRISDRQFAGGAAAMATATWPQGDFWKAREKQFRAAPRIEYTAGPCVACIISACSLPPASCASF